MLNMRFEILLTRIFRIVYTMNTFICNDFFEFFFIFPSAKNGYFSFFDKSNIRRIPILFFRL